MLEEYKKSQPLFYNYAKKIIEDQKIAHAYLIETNGVSYGFDIALALSKSFLCNKNYLNSKKCLKECNICANIDALNYPDLKIIETESKIIKKEQILELQQMFSTKPLYGKYLIYIIKDAQLLNKSSANTILKFLEEPSDNIIAILLTDNSYNCIETITSRCQILSLINNEEKINKKMFLAYCDKENIDEYIVLETNDIISFYKNLEEKKTNMLIENNCYQYKEKIDLFLQVGLAFYMEVLNYKLGIKKNLFNDYLDTIKEIVEKNETNDIIKKIDCLNQFLENSKFNVNKELFIDNFVITFSGGIDEN